MAPRIRPRRAAMAALMALALTVAACVPSLLGGPAYRLFGPSDAGAARAGTVALFVSGDSGLRYGMGRRVAKALAAHGIPTIGISSSTAFASTRTRAQVDAVLIDGMRRALAVPGAQRMVLIGQSFGADMLATAAPDLSGYLRHRVAAIMLVVPGRSAYYRADPLGFAYHGTPDAAPAAGMREVDWAPVICIQGASEKDSLCPELAGSATSRIVLPGGHFLDHDDQRLIVTILDRLRAIGIGTRPASATSPEPTDG